MSVSLKRVLSAAVLPVSAVLLLAAPMSASASISYGTLSNFDVFNDTGEVTHGFEIELDGISSADITYKFGAPYERYGNPTVTDFPGGVFVHYESSYDPAAHSFTQGTPMAPNPVTPTMGHSCWTGGSPGYANAGCEHFGLGLRKNPTNTVYRWLVADPTSPGSLTPAGTNVSIPAPVWNVSPAPVAAVNQAPIVQAVIPPPPAPPVYEFGTAQWVKVFVTESADQADLNHLLSDDPKVPQSPAETETEWVLMQDDSANPGANDLGNEAQMHPGDKSVTRRYEFYKYSGAIDPETHEALPINSAAPDSADLGDYVGAQMAAVNVGAGAGGAPVAVAGPLAGGEQGVAYTAPLVTGGTQPMSITITKGALPAGVTANHDGTISGRPTAARTAKFTAKVVDANGQSVTAAHTAVIAHTVLVGTRALAKAHRTMAYTTTLLGKYGVPPYSWSLDGGTLPDGLVFNAATGVISGTPSAGSTTQALTFGVTDAMGATASVGVALRVGK